MRFIKVTTTNGQTEYLSLDKVLAITPGGETTKILYGAGMYWNVYSDSVRVLDLSTNEIEAIARGESEGE
jgi:hypothetical protein